MNTYAYVGSRPTRLTDKHGLAANAVTIGVGLTARAIGGQVAVAAIRRTLVKAMGATLGGAISCAAFLVCSEAEVREANPQPSTADDQCKPDLTDDRGRKHILEGDETTGGHRSGTGRPGKSEFPQGWSDDKILGEVSDVATDPESRRRTQADGRTVVEGTGDGVDIRVVVEPSGRIVTGFPTNTPRNPW